eukprot:TRINITY_DN19976_c0_g1_i1.p1 TRINITY_DN19976_c0_g1~~TRINITY_DN19976_c0_g1_i1.p1  ORF type:complete len:167 (-),score=23.31 TRINITY_DN19976_c0_g1_i1:46-507(-)
MSYSTLQRGIAYAISVTVSLCLVGFLVVLLTCWLHFVQYLKSFTYLPSFFSLIPPIVYALVMRQMNGVCAAVAHQLTFWENHQTRSAHNTSWIVKRVAFGFVNNYLSFFYLLFVKGDLQALQKQLQTVLITNLVVGNISEVLIPIIKARIRQV